MHFGWENFVTLDLQERAGDYDEVTDQVEVEQFKDFLDSVNPDDFAS